MRFLVDAQLPAALAEWLAAQGHHAEHVSGCGLARASDLEIWERAGATSAVVVTKDEDFTVLRSRSGASQPAIVWLRIGNTRRAALLQWFAPLFTRIVGDLERGELLIEVV